MALDIILSASSLFWAQTDHFHLLSLCSTTRLTTERAKKVQTKRDWEEAKGGGRKWQRQMSGGWKREVGEMKAGWLNERDWAVVYSRLCGCGCLDENMLLRCASGFGSFALPLLARCYTSQLQRLASVSVATLPPIPEQPRTLGNAYWTPIGTWHVGIQACHLSHKIQWKKWHCQHFLMARGPPSKHVDPNLLFMIHRHMKPTFCVQCQRNLGIE